MIRVLSVIHYPFFGGPHNQALRLAEPLRKRGYDTLVVLPDHPGNAFDRLSAGGVEVTQTRLGRLRASRDWRVQRDSLFALVGDVPRLRRLIRREGADLVVLHGLVNPQGGIAATSVGVPVVWQILDTRTPPVLRLAFAPLVRALSSAVMTTGYAVAEEHPGLPRDPARLFSFFPPVDTALFRPDEEERATARSALGWRPEDVVIGCVANVTPQKGLETFVSVAMSVAAARPDVRFALFGSRMSTQDDYARRVLDQAAPLLSRGQLAVENVDGGVELLIRALDVFLATAVLGRRAFQPRSSKRCRPESPSSPLTWELSARHSTTGERAMSSQPATRSCSHVVSSTSSTTPIVA